VPAATQEVSPVIEFSDLAPFLITFASLVAAGMGFPIPEELPVVGAGVWAALPTTVAEYGLLRFLILPVCILGVVISDGLLYGIGRRFGVRLLESKLGTRMLPPKKREEIEQNFHKHGVKVLLFARLLPGIRSPIFIMAGIMRLPLRRFLLADGIYAIPGVSLLFFLAFWFGQQFADLIEAFERGVINYLRPLLILVFLGAVIGYLIYHVFKSPFSTGDPKEVPIISKVMRRENRDSPNPNDPACTESPHPLERRRPQPLERDRD
jgi:membrane protein DedA with SNARE-associated domain